MDNLLECDGDCENHIGDIKKVKVYGHEWVVENPWIFNYCDTAIKEDIKCGFTVEEI